MTIAWFSEDLDASLLRYRFNAIRMTDGQKCEWRQSDFFVSRIQLLSDNDIYIKIVSSMADT